MIPFRRQYKQAVMPKYCRMCKFSILVHLVILFAVHKHVTGTYSILKVLPESEFLAYKTHVPGNAFFLVSHFMQIQGSALYFLPGFRL